FLLPCARRKAARQFLAVDQPFGLGVGADQRGRKKRKRHAGIPVSTPSLVIPAKAGTQRKKERVQRSAALDPACAGMTKEGNSRPQAASAWRKLLLVVWSPASHRLSSAWALARRSSSPAEARGSSQVNSTVIPLGST